MGYRRKTDTTVDIAGFTAIFAFTAHPLWQWVQRFVTRYFTARDTVHLTLSNNLAENARIIDLNSLSDHLISLTLPAMGASLHTC